MAFTDFLQKLPIVGGLFKPSPLNTQPINTQPIPFKQTSFAVPSLQPKTPLASLPVIPKFSVKTPAKIDVSGMKAAPLKITGQETLGAATQRIDQTAQQISATIPPPVPSGVAPEHVTSIPTEQEKIRQRLDEFKQFQQELGIPQINERYQKILSDISSKQQAFDEEINKIRQTAGTLTGIDEAKIRTLGNQRNLEIDRLQRTATLLENQLKTQTNTLSDFMGIAKEARADVIAAQKQAREEAKPFGIPTTENILQFNRQTRQYEVVQSGIAKLPASLEEYAVSQQQGFQGSYLDFVKETKAGAGLTLDPASMNFWANYTLQTGTIPPLGFGGLARVQYLKGVANIAGQQGFSGQSLGFKKAAFDANKAGLTQVTRFLASASAFESKALGQTKIVSNLSKAVDRTGSPIVNKYLLFIKGQIAGDTDTLKLQNAITTFATEYAKIMTGSTSSAVAATDSARKEAEGLISAAMGRGTIDAQLNLMKQEMKLSIQGFKEEQDQLRVELGGGTVETQTTSDAGLSDEEAYNLYLNK